MKKRYVRGLGPVAILALALAIAGCGDSKKGKGGYSYLGHTHSGVLHTPNRLAG